MPRRNRRSVGILTISSNDQGISWGPAVHYLELWNAFAESFRSTWEIRGLVPSWTGLPCIKTPIFRLRQVRVPNVGMLRQVFFDLAAAFRILVARRGMIIYIRLSSFHLLVMAALWLTGRPFCLEMNGIAASDSQSAGRSSRFRRWALAQELWLVRTSTLVLAVSGSIAEYAERVGAQRVKVIPNSVSPDFFRIRRISAAGEPVRIIYVGTYTSWDGSDRLPELARRFPKVRFIMVGDGARRREIEGRSPGNMQYLGAVAYSELPGHYGSVDAGIVLYERERHKTVELSSMKVQEYVAAGLPVFSTDVPGQEFIEEQGIGVLARNDDVGEEFAGFLSALPELKRRVEEYRRGKGRQHSWEDAARLTEQAIVAAWSERGRGTPRRDTA
jgi:glycosyltransferase involved in cell wall biosynthesis